MSSEPDPGPTADAEVDRPEPGEQVAPTPGEEPTSTGEQPVVSPPARPQIGAVLPAPSPVPGATPGPGGRPLRSLPGPPPERPAGTAWPKPGVAVGRIVEATVSAVHAKEVEVRLLDGRTGVIPRSEFGERVEVGEAVEGALLARDDPKQRTVLSRAWALRQRAWEQVDAARAEHTPLRGRVTKAVKGGLVVDIGLRGFLPASLFPEGVGPEGAKSLVGQEVEVLVVEADRNSDRLVVSIRDLERRRRRSAERDRLRSLEPGGRVTGTVASLADHGAVVDLGGVRGLVHRSELTWGRLGRVEDVVSVGDEVEVVVLDVQRTKRRVSLSLRAAQPDPYEGLAVGAVLPGTISRVVDYGAFVRLEGGAEGLVHISELSDVPGYRPDQLVVPGEEVAVKVLDVDRDRHRLSLSVRQVLLGD